MYDVLKCEYFLLFRIYSLLFAKEAIENRFCFLCMLENTISVQMQDHVKKTSCFSAWRVTRVARPGEIRNCQNVDG